MLNIVKKTKEIRERDYRCDICGGFAGPTVIFEDSYGYMEDFQIDKYVIHICCECKRKLLLNILLNNKIQLYKQHRDDFASEEEMDDILLSLDEVNNLIKGE